MKKNLIFKRKIKIKLFLQFIFFLQLFYLYLKNLIMLFEINSRKLCDTAYFI